MSDGNIVAGLSGPTNVVQQSLVQPLLANATAPVVVLGALPAQMVANQPPTIVVYSVGPPGQPGPPGPGPSAWAVDDFSALTDGARVAFTLGFVPVAGSERVIYDNAVLLATYDYTIAATTLTLTVAPRAGASLEAIYQHA